MEEARKGVRGAIACVGLGGVVSFMPKTIRGEPGLRELVGVRFDPTPWLAIGQERIDAFASATGDDQWIHVDPAKAAASAFGTTIAHGYLTLSLIPYFWRQAATIEGFIAAINYGLGRVRFPAPVLVPARLRARFKVTQVLTVDRGCQATLHVELEREGEVKPVCVAEVIVRYLCQ
jgi:acyl dehydratase